MSSYPNIRVAEQATAERPRETEVAATTERSSDDQQIKTAVEKYLKEIEAKKEAEAKQLKQESAAMKEQNSSASSSKVDAATDTTMQGRWNNGLELSTKDREFRVHVGGRFQFDTATLIVPQSIQSQINTPYHDGVDFRRARLRVDGSMYETIDWASEFDFVNAILVRNQPVNGTSPGFAEATVTAPTDLWVQAREVPVFGTIRLGNQKEQIGFEHIVSSRFQPFMERSFNQDSFYGGSFNGFSPGIQFFRNYGTDARGVLSGGLFKPVNNVFGYSVGDFDYSVVGRITRLLQYEEDGARLVHVGLSGRQASAVESQGVPARFTVFRTRDAIRAGLAQDWPSPASITLFGDDSQTVNGELAIVQGPWTIQGEYLVNGLQDARLAAFGPQGTTAVYHGGYIQILRFLTSDHDHYDTKTGVFERVSPRENFRWLRKRHHCNCNGIGALQIGSRYNYLDLNDEGLNGGVLHNLTTGLNWFWNPNMKFQLNHIATYRDVSDTTAFPLGSGWIHGFGTRMAIDF